MKKKRAVEFIAKWHRKQAFIVAKKIESRGKIAAYSIS
jgi:hypothetical protein